MATDFGTGLDMVTDLPLRWSMASGRKNLGNAIARRLLTARGTLKHAPDYGLDVRAYVNMAQTRTAILGLESAIAREVEKDPRVLAASVRLAFNAPRSTLTVTISVTTASGPFPLVLGVSALTVQLLGGL